MIHPISDSNSIDQDILITSRSAFFVRWDEELTFFEGDFAHSDLPIGLCLRLPSGFIDLWLLQFFNRIRKGVANLDFRWKIIRLAVFISFYLRLILLVSRTKVVSFLFPFLLPHFLEHLSIQSLLLLPRTVLNITVQMLTSKTQLANQFPTARALTGFKTLLFDKIHILLFFP